MLCFANAKINIGLQITGKRADGYHLLESLFVPITLADIIEVLPLGDDATEDTLTVLGDIEVGAVEDNLVLRAVRCLREQCSFPFVSIILKKFIPAGAGMGGGSSDASVTLSALRNLFSLSISDEELEKAALSLGADCPFFLRNKMMMVRGIGELFTSAPDINLSSYTLVVVKPDVHISTAEAFRGLTKIGGHIASLETILSRSVNEWRGIVHNDFEDSLFPEYPVLAALKAKLYDMGAVYASMTGSGAALYGLFERRLNSEEQRQFDGCFFWQGSCL